MEQAEVSSRPVVGAIVVVSGLARIDSCYGCFTCITLRLTSPGDGCFCPPSTRSSMDRARLRSAWACISSNITTYQRIARACCWPSRSLSVFLVSYIVNHALHGDTIFPGHGPVRTLYLSILASHVILSIVALPMVLTTFFFSLTGRFAMHRRIARFTFPIWLYVSITGVVVFVFLKAYVY